MSRIAVTVAAKELRDHGRDLRSLAASGLYVLMGPLVIAVLLLEPTGRFGSATGLVSMAAVFSLVAAFAGGMNVAMDCVAGERERRSLVPLLANPVSRSDVVLGKWAAISAFACAGLVVNLLATAVVVHPMRRLAEDPVHGMQALIWLGVAVAPLVLLAAAIELLVSTWSHNTKAAHTYLSMLVFVPMMTGLMLVFFPGDGVLAAHLPLGGQHVALLQAIGGESPAVLPVLATALGTMALIPAPLWVAVVGLGRDRVALAEA